MKIDELLKSNFDKVNVKHKLLKGYDGIHMRLGANFDEYNDLNSILLYLISVFKPKEVQEILRDGDWSISFSGDPFGSHDSSGYFGFTWKSTGAYTSIPEGNLNLSANNGRNAFLRWVNNTSGYGTNMCIFNGETSKDVDWSFDPSPTNGFSNNYLTIDVFNMRMLGYTYSAKKIIISEYDSGRSMFAMGIPKETLNGDNYLSIALPEDVDVSDIETVIRQIENGELNYKSSKDMMSYSDFDYKPIIFDQVDNIITTSPIFSDDTLVQYKYNQKWHNAIAISPRQYSFLKDSTDIRIMNKLTGEVYCEMPVE